MSLFAYAYMHGLIRCPFMHMHRFQYWVSKVLLSAFHCISYIHKIPSCGEINKGESTEQGTLNQDGAECVADLFSESMLHYKHGQSPGDDNVSALHFKWRD
jgi:hypothetical protein